MAKKQRKPRPSRRPNDMIVGRVDESGNKFLEYIEVENERWLTATRIIVAQLAPSSDRWIASGNEVERVTIRAAADVYEDVSAWLSNYMESPWVVWIDETTNEVKAECVFGPVLHDGTVTA